MAMLHTVQHWRAVCAPLGSLAVRCVSTSSLSAQQAATRVKSFAEVPGPRPLPLVGNLLEMARQKKTKMLSEFYEEGLRKYGGIMKLILPGVGKFIVVADPNVLEEVLRAEGKYPVRDKTITPQLKWLVEQSGYPSGFGTEDGEAWKQGRSAANRQIQPRNVNSYIEGLNPIYSRFTSYLRKTRDKDYQIEDFYSIVQKLTMEVTCKFVYDADLNLLTNPSEEDIKFLSHVNDFFEGLNVLLTEPPIYRIYRNKFYYFFTNAYKSCVEHGKKYANTILEKVGRGEEPGEVQGMLEQWLREKKMSTKFSLVMASGMLTAGIHTTANQSTFMLYEMTKNPEVQQKLFEEIQEVVGDRAPTAHDIATAMPYLNGCIKESFRVRATAPTFSRVLQEDTVIHGYHIPAGVTVLYSANAASKNEEIFEEPSKFKPERWIRKDGPQQHPFALLPFGFGPRACYGKRFAELEMKLLLIEMIRNFKLETKMEDMEVVEVATVTPKEKVSLDFIDR